MSSDLFGKKLSESENFENATATKVRNVVPRCPVCHKETLRHQFAQIATTTICAENRARVSELYRHVKNHEWGMLANFKDFRGDQDDAVAYALRGPHAGGAVILIRDPFELYGRVEILLQEAVTSEEVAAISALVPENEWQELR